MALLQCFRISKGCCRCLKFQRKLRTFPVSLLPRKAFQVGEEAKLSRVFTEKDVETFAELTGDQNPLHVNEKYAEKTRFGRCIVHGVLLNGLVSAVLGNILPGHGCILVSQQIRFPSPLFIGDKVTVSVKIMKFSHSIMICETVCTAEERKEIVLSGEVKLLVPPTE